MVNTTYITALYDIRSKDKRNHSGIEKRIELLKKLFSVNIPIVAFLDPEFEIFFKDNNLPTNVKCIYRPLNSFSIYLTLTTTEPKLELPENRSIEKDTIEFLALMNTKAEFVAEGSKFCETENVAWIDASIFHILNDEKRVKEYLETKNHTVEKIRIPGPIFQKTIDRNNLVKSVQWKYAGGYFICKREYSEIFL